jgi:hypothetical protein
VHSTMTFSALVLVAGVSLAWNKLGFAAPPIRCTVGTASWCLTAFDGSVSMRDTPSSRIWELRARLASPGPPMVITEAKECSDSMRPQVTLMAESHESVGGSVVHRATYRLDENGCTLEFALPESSAYTDYRQFMLYGVLAVPARPTQLYKATRQ